MAELKSDYKSSDCKPSKATIRDVAKVAGVSITTVSLALRGSGRISDTRTRNIHKIADKMNYRPHLAAQLLRAKKAGYIGLIMGGNIANLAQSGFELPILVNFVDTCEQEEIRYHIECFRTSRESFSPPTQITARMVDGVILAGFVDKQLRQWLTKYKPCPWVSIDEPAEYCVISMSDDGLYNAARHLVALGHRKIAFMTGDTAASTAFRLTKEGFAKAVEDFRIDNRQGKWIGEFHSKVDMDMFDKCREWISGILSDTEPPTAFICADSLMARAVVYLALKRGLDVPADLSVIACGTPLETEKAYPYLSSASLDYPEMMRKAVHMLNHLVAGRAVTPRICRTAPLLIMRNTVARPRTR